LKFTINLQNLKKFTINNYNSKIYMIMERKKGTKRRVPKFFFFQVKVLICANFFRTAIHFCAFILHECAQRASIYLISLGKSGN